jgi:transcriptional regulator GlxA family with amidase domain
MRSRQICALLFSLCGAVILTTPSYADEQSKSSDRRNVAIVVHDGVELLDFAGPGEVFSAAGGGRAFRVFTVSETDKPIKSQRFLTVTPEYTIANCPKPDIIVIPGGATGVLLRSPAFMTWIREQAPKAEVMFSVCTGAFVLADAGLLDGLEATTHHGSISGLKKYAKINVREDLRVVDNGKIVTAAGVSAGIDGALHLVARLSGQQTAQGTARYMEYRWQPEPAKTGQPAPATAKPSADSNPDYERARTQARSGQKQEALASLERAFAAGFKRLWTPSWPVSAVNRASAISSRPTLGRARNSRRSMSLAIR